MRAAIALDTLPEAVKENLSHLPITDIVSSGTWVSTQILSNFCSYLEQQRKKRRFTYTSLAKASNLSSQYVYWLEKKKEGFQNHIFSLGVPYKEIMSKAGYGEVESVENIDLYN